MKKRITAMLLSLAMLFALQTAVWAEETSLTIDAPQTLPAAGETFTVKVSISGNPGLCAAQFTLSFDKSVVECQKAKLGSVLSGMLSATNPKGKSGAIIAAAATEEKTGDGVVAEYTFKVLKEGDAAFALIDGVFSDIGGRAVATNVPKKQAEQTQSTEQTQQTESSEQTQQTEQTPSGQSAGTQTAGGAVTTQPVGEAKGETQPTAEASVQTFTDVPASYWGYEYIQKAAELKLVRGNPDGTFAPQKEMTRAEFVTMLYRLSGDGAVAQGAAFDDVSSSSWYYDAVSWAAAKGYATGNGASFRPNGKITRQEVVTILFRFNGGVSGMEAMLAGMGVDNFARYSDRGEIASWAKSAMEWAVFAELVNGTSDTTISPNGTARRAQVAAIFVRYAGK